MLALSPTPALETLAFLAALAGDEADYQADVLKARQYNDGQQFVALTDRLRMFLGGDTTNTEVDYQRLRLNVCHTVLAAVTERLLVAGFDSDEAPQEMPVLDARGQPTTALVKPGAAWAWRIWQQNRMDAKQRSVHAAVLRDSEAFVLVDWDTPHNRPRFTPHQRYVDTQIDGDGEGCRAFYRNDDPDQDLLFVTKQWTEVTYHTGRRNQRRRLTVYYPDRIEKYAGFPGSWQPVTDGQGEPWPIPWLDGFRRPLGIPVAHGRNSAGMEAREAWPLQNLINKILVDLATESDMSAFRIMLAFGWQPVDSDGEPLVIEPGRWMGSTNPTASAMAVPGSDLQQFMNAIDFLVLKVASITDTPVSRFVTTRQVSSEGTQKQGDGPLLNKCRNRQGELGNLWEDAFSIARRLENTYGQGGLDETVFLSTVWSPLEVRDEKADLEAAEIKQRLGMPIRLIAKGMDLDQNDIALWEAEAERRAGVAAAIGGQDDGEEDETLAAEEAESAA